MRSDLFRSFPWVDAWVETWGADRRITLIDLGGSKNPLEMVYTIRHCLKKIIPTSTLVVAGNGFAGLSTPRAEYNNLESLIAAAGGIDVLGKELYKIKWGQFILSDIKAFSPADTDIHQLIDVTNAYLSLQKSEIAYSVVCSDFKQYLQLLGANTRTAYFNRRSRLAEHGEIELINYSVATAETFFKILNAFHIPRWGRPCYSQESIKFLCGFNERLHASGGGAPILQVMFINGEAVSCIYDIEWNGVRYNLQSGYLENRFPKIALGSIHFGFAIQNAIEKGLTYDFMAGVGKNSNYKQKVANHTEALNTYILPRGMIKTLYKLYGK